MKLHHLTPQAKRTEEPSKAARIVVLVTSSMMLLFSLCAIVAVIILLRQPKHQMTLILYLLAISIALFYLGLHPIIFICKR